MSLLKGIPKSLEGLYTQEARVFAVVRRQVGDLGGLRKVLAELHPSATAALAMMVEFAEEVFRGLISLMEARHRLLRGLSTVGPYERRAEAAFLAEFEGARVAQFPKNLLQHDPTTLVCRLTGAGWFLEADRTDVRKLLLYLEDFWATLVRERGQVWELGAVEESESVASLESVTSSPPASGLVLTKQELRESSANASGRAVGVLQLAQQLYNKFGNRLRTLEESPTCGRLSKLVALGIQALRHYTQSYSLMTFGVELQQFTAMSAARRERLRQFVNPPYARRT